MFHLVHSTAREGAVRVVDKHGQPCDRQRRVIQLPSPDPMIGIAIPFGSRVGVNRIQNGR